MPTGSPPEMVPGARWEELFDELVELPAHERARRLDELRAADAELAGRLERLLAADAAATGFLDQPTQQLLAGGGLGETADDHGGKAAGASGSPGASGDPGAAAGDHYDWSQSTADAAAEEPQLPPGAAVGSWRVVNLAGRGGMGEVYLAERGDRAFAQRVALKVIKRGMDSQAIVRRFVRERQILARLDHANLARLLDGGTGPDGRPYFALEWV
jgi:hypothetical protein